MIPTGFQYNIFFMPTENIPRAWNCDGMVEPNGMDSFNSHFCATSQLSFLLELQREETQHTWVEAV